MQFGTKYKLLYKYQQTEAQWNKQKRHDLVGSHHTIYLAKQYKNKKTFNKDYK